MNLLIVVPGGWSASSTPEECQAAIGDSTSFLVMLRRKFFFVPNII